MAMMMRLYAAIRLLSILASGEQSLADIYDALPKFENTPEFALIALKSENLRSLMKSKTRLSNMDHIDINAIDGVRVSNDDGWWLLRASNTQAVLAARCESSTQSRIDAIKKRARWSN